MGNVAHRPRDFKPVLPAAEIRIGRYVVQDMTVLVSRGAGTWGPRMRLWRPGEIMFVTLRSPRPGRGR